MLSVRVGRSSAPCLKVYKTKHVRRGAVSGRGRRDSRGGRPSWNLDHTGSYFSCQIVAMTSRNYEFSGRENQRFHGFGITEARVSLQERFDFKKNDFEGYVPEIMLLAPIWWRPGEPTKAILEPNKFRPHIGTSGVGPFFFRRKRGLWTVFATGYQRQVA